MMRLLLASVKLQRAIDAEVKTWLDGGITAFQTTIILHLGQHDGITQKDLREALNCDQGNLARTLGAMEEKKGWIKRRRSFSVVPSFSYISLTDTGNFVFGKIQCKMQASTLGSDLAAVTLAINNSL